eukprot:gene20629-biopygen29391
MEAALRDVDAWISTSMMVADLDLKRREVLRLIRYTRSHREVTNVMAFAGPMLRDETFEVDGGNDTDDDDDDDDDPSSITEDFRAEKFMEATPEFFYDVANRGCIRYNEGMFSTTVTPRTVEKELAKIPPGDLINRMNININTNQIKKTSTLDKQDAITKLVQIIETATKQKEDFDKATRDFYIVYDKLKIAIMEACGTGPKLCGTVNSAIKTQKKNS